MIIHVLIDLNIGGVSQALLQMQNTDVDVLISLDSGSGYRYGIELMRKSIYCDSTAVNVPYMHAHGRAAALYHVEKDFTLYESWASLNAYPLTFEHLSHPDFRSHNIVERKNLNPERAADVIASYDILSQAVLFFLNAYLKEITAAENRLPGLGQVTEH